jgi:hypothetical protein
MIGEEEIDLDFGRGEKGRCKNGVSAFRALGSSIRCLLHPRGNGDPQMLGVVGSVREFRRRLLCRDLCDLKDGEDEKGTEEG